MHKTDAANNVANEFSDGAPPLTPGTSLGAKWHNTVQRELVAVVEGAGLVLSDADDGQVKDALDVMYGRLAAPTNTWTGDQDFNGGDVNIDPGGLTVDGPTDLQAVTATTVNAATSVTAPAVTGSTSVTSPAVTGSTSVTTPKMVLTGSAPTYPFTGLSNTLVNLNVPKAWGYIEAGNNTITNAEVFNAACAVIPAKDVAVSLPLPMATGSKYAVTASVHGLAIGDRAIVEIDDEFGFRIRVVNNAGTQIDLTSGAVIRAISFMVFGRQ
jgi:hypothetical protein